MKLLLVLSLFILACAPNPKDPTFYPDCSYTEGVTATVHHFFIGDTLTPRAPCVLSPDQGSHKLSVNLFSFYLPNLKEGEEIEAYMQWEITNDMPGNMMVAWFMVLADTPDSYEGEILRGSLGKNITVNVHHDVHHTYSPFHFVKEPGDKYLNLVVYSASDAHINGKHVIAEPLNNLSIRRH